MSVQMLARIKRRTGKLSKAIRTKWHRAVDAVRSFFRGIYIYAWVFGSVEATQQDFDAFSTGLLFVACVGFATFFVVMCREAAAIFDSLKINLALLALGLAMLAADINAAAEWAGGVGERIRKFWERM
jgi:hypothetical protein